jgi:hypothetical protein
MNEPHAKIRNTKSSQRKLLLPQKCLTLGGVSPEFLDHSNKQTIWGESFENTKLQPDTSVTKTAGS